MKYWIASIIFIRYNIRIMSQNQLSNATIFLCLKQPDSITWFTCGKVGVYLRFYGYWSFSASAVSSLLSSKILGLILPSCWVAFYVSSLRLKAIFSTMFLAYLIVVPMLGFAIKMAYMVRWDWIYFSLYPQRWSEYGCGKSILKPHNCKLRVRFHLNNSASSCCWI